MPGGLDKYERFLPVFVTPEGQVHYEDPPIAVMATIRARRPDMAYEARAWAIAWTRNAVLVFWMEPRTTPQPRTRWIAPSDVKRVDRE
jgi:hypothetical protein